MKNTLPRINVRNFTGTKKIYDKIVVLIFTKANESSTCVKSVPDKTILITDKTLFWKCIHTRLVCCNVVYPFSCKPFNQLLYKPTATRLRNEHISEHSVRHCGSGSSHGTPYNGHCRGGGKMNTLSLAVSVSMNSQMWNPFSSSPALESLQSRSWYMYNRNRLTRWSPPKYLFDLSYAI